MSRNHPSPTNDEPARNNLAVHPGRVVGQSDRNPQLPNHIIPDLPSVQQAQSEAEATLDEALDQLYRLSLRPGEPELLEWIASLVDSECAS